MGLTGNYDQAEMAGRAQSITRSNGLKDVLGTIKQGFKMIGIK